MDELNRVHLDSASLRVLAHPLRSRILGRLRAEGPATATRLAVRLGTNSGTTSYHLRKLAEVGLVVEDTTSGDQRDRWWRAAHEVTSWSQAEFRDDPDDRAAAGWLLGYHLRTLTQKTQDWLDASPDWPVEWLGAAELSDLKVNLTPDQTTAMSEELHAVILRYLRLGEAADVQAGPTPPVDPTAPARVFVALHLHPDVGAPG
jgi:DNA-binding transcriptional ArsR family regulator